MCDRLSALTNPGTNSRNIDTNAMVSAADPNQSINLVVLIIHLLTSLAGLAFAKTISHFPTLTPFHKLSVMTVTHTAKWFSASKFSTIPDNGLYV